MVAFGVPRWRLIIRGMLFVLIAGFMFFSPAAAHLLPKDEQIKYTRGWKLFRGFGVGVCQVRYTTHEGEVVTPLDRYALLGYTEKTAPGWLRRIRWKGKSGRSLRAINKRMCRALGDDAETLHLDARCAGWDGWIQRHEPDVPVCTTSGRTRGGGRS